MEQVETDEFLNFKRCADSSGCIAIHPWASMEECMGYNLYRKFRTTVSKASHAGRSE
jgi:hypothetical protein